MCGVFDEPDRVKVCAASDRCSVQQQRCRGLGDRHPGNQVPGHTLIQGNAGQFTSVESTGPVQTLLRIGHCSPSRPDCERRRSQLRRPRTGVTTNSDRAQRQLRPALARCFGGRVERAGHLGRLSHHQINDRSSASTPYPTLPRSGTPRRFLRPRAVDEGALDAEGAPGPGRPVTASGSTCGTARAPCRSRGVDAVTRRAGGGVETGSPVVYDDVR